MTIQEHLFCNGQIVININNFPGRYRLSQAKTSDDLVNLGYSTKYKESYKWTKKEDKILQKIIDDIASKEVILTVADPCYYISHYVFHGAISTKNISERIDQLIADKKNKVTLLTI